MRLTHTTLMLCLALALLVAGASALDGYDYYQTIDYAATDVETYQQDIIIHRTTGTAYTETAGGLEVWHIYVGDHCREDYGDLRFTDSTGAELAYYLWPGYDAESARFAVRLEGATTAGVLQVWYGNPSATTTSNRDAVIPIYFDFDDGSLTGWVRQDQYRSPGFTLIDSAGRGKVLKAGPTSLTAGLYYRELEYSGGGLLCFSANCPTVGIGHRQEGMEAIAVATYQGETLLMTHVAAFSNKVQDDSAAGTLYVSFNTFKYAPDSKHTFIHLNPLGFGNWVTHSIPFSDNGANKIRIIFKHCDGSGNGANACWDDIYIRTYSATPPAAITFSGEQETTSPPVTAFTANTTAGLAPLTVQFTDTSTGSPTSWNWTFGDGGTSSEQNPQHTYTTPGLYTVTLNATNEYGSDYELKTDYITVYGPVTAQFTANITGGTAPVAVQFTDLSTGGPTAWSWSFGDGNTSTAQNPQHTYTIAGTHTVTLTASHPYSSDTETKTSHITVAVLQPFPGIGLTPRDLNGDGLAEDINGNGRLDYNDLTIFFQNLEWARTAQPTEYFDFNGNGRLDYADVVVLFQVIKNA